MTGDAIVVQEIMTKLRHVLKSYPSNEGIIALLAISAGHVKASGGTVDNAITALKSVWDVVQNKHPYLPS
jgi:hypothetical protein